MENVAILPQRWVTGAVTPGTPVVLETMPFPFPMTVTALPGGGGTLNVEYSTTPKAAGNPGAATWIAWPAGAVSVNTSNTLISPVTALRFTAATATGKYEVTS